MTGTFDAETNRWTPPNSDWAYTDIHPESQSCREQGCMIHNPTEEWVGNREDWPYFPRGDGRMERLCRHGVGHPDPDAARWLNKVAPNMAADIHGCDGCCLEPNPVNPHFDKENS